MYIRPCLFCVCFVVCYCDYCDYCDYSHTQFGDTAPSYKHTNKYDVSEFKTLFILTITFFIFHQMVNSSTLARKLLILISWEVSIFSITVSVVIPQHSRSNTVPGQVK